MEIKKVVFALFAIFTVLLSIDIVCADDVTDLNMGSAMDSHSIGADSSIAEDISIADNEENNLDGSSLEEKSLLSDSSVDDEGNDIGESIDENAFGEGNPLSFKNLSDEINSAKDVLEITSDYAFNAETDGDFINGIPINNKDLVINGNNHIIDGSGQAKIFKLFDVGITINNLTFINSNGSAIWANYSDISTSNLFFKDNFASEGAAICGYNTDYYSKDDKFINNYAEKGAAIYLEEDSALNLDNGTFASDKDLYYGLLCLKESKLAVLNTTFLNITSIYSPAFYGHDVNYTFKNCRFINLFANMTGGAIAVASLMEYMNVVEKCTFINVSSARNGGAIYFEMLSSYSGSGLFVSNSQFINCSSGFGGAILNLGGELKIQHSNFTNNLAKYQGGAIYSNIAFITNIFYSNFANNTLMNLSSELNKGTAVYVFSISDGFRIRYCNFTDNMVDYSSTIFAESSFYSILDSYFKGNGQDIYTTFDKPSSISKNNTFIDGTQKYNQQDYEWVIEGNSSDIEFNPIIIDDTYASASYFNLKDFGIESAIKDQKHTENCWAFGTSTALEMALLKATGGALKANFSVNNVVFYPKCFSIYGDAENADGGDAFAAASYFLSWFGGTLNEDATFDELGRIAIVPKTQEKFHLQGIVALPIIDSSRNLKIYKEALVKYGALSVTVNAPNSVIKDDYNNKTYAAYYYPEADFEEAKSNHIVVLVGWDDNFSKNNFIKTPPGDGAWILQNSWGNEWGDNGYYYVSYYDNAIFTLNSPVGFVIDGNSPYTKNYQYDFAISEFDYDFAEEAKAYANVYTATGNDLISAVGTYFDKISASYRIIFSVNGVQVYSQSGKSTVRGYETIKLNKAIAVNKGDKFRIEIQGKFAPVSSLSYFPLQKGVCLVDYGEGFENISKDGDVVSIKAYAIPNPAVANHSVKYYSDQTPFTLQVEPNAEVTFEINGVKATLKADENGIVEIGINLKPGNYSIEVDYNGTKMVYPITIKSTIVSQDVSRGYNSKYDYKVRLLNSTGGAVKNAKVSVTVNGKAKTYTSDSNGYITIPFAKLTSNQAVSVTNPITKERSKNVIKVVSRFAGNKNIRMYYNNGTKYSLKVYGDNAKLVGANQIVVIKLNKKTYKVKTNNKGIASLRIPKTLKPGTYKISASYKGQTVKNTIKALSRIVGNKNLNMYYYDGSRYNVKVLSKNGKALAKQLVTFRINKKNYKVKSNSKGIASLKIPYTVKPGTYTILAKYAGLSVKNKVKVKQVLISKKTVSVKKYAKKLVLKATLKNGKKALKNKAIRFKFKGKTYKTKTNSKGLAKVTLKRKVTRKLKRGKQYTVSVIYLKDVIKTKVKVKR